MFYILWTHKISLLLFLSLKHRCFFAYRTCMIIMSSRSNTPRVYALSTDFLSNNRRIIWNHNAWCESDQNFDIWDETQSDRHVLFYISTTKFLFKETSTCSSAQPGAGIWTSDLADLLYPLSYSRPSAETVNSNKQNKEFTMETTF